MECFGILCSVPVAFVMSTACCAILAHTIRPHERLRGGLCAGSFVVLIGFLSEVVLLATLGAVGSRALVGPSFYVAHCVFFFLGTPALASVLILPRQSPFVRRWYIASVVCTAFAFCLVLLQYGVSEALYGVNGDNGPYS
jgi:hypothetical protein